MRSNGALGAAMVAVAMAQTHDENKDVFYVTPRLASKADDLESPPDRLSVNPHDHYYHPCVKRTAVKIDGIERDKDVDEYCISGGWAEIRQKNEQGKYIIDAHGRALTKRITGVIEPYFTRLAPVSPSQPSRFAPIDPAVTISAAEQKRQRKAAKRIEQMSREADERRR